MLFRSFQKFSVSRPILEAATVYKKSATQQKMHEFDQNQQQIMKAKSRLDYQTINKQSEGCVLIRQFLFQEKQTIYQINYPEKYLVPTGKWSLEQLQKTIQDMQQLNETPSQNENKIMLRNFQPELQQKLKGYYKNIGKNDYTFSVVQEVQKIENMTIEQFQQFMSNLKKQTEK